MPSERALVEVNAGNVDAEIGRTVNLTSQYPSLVYTREPLLTGDLLAWTLPDMPNRRNISVNLAKYSVGILQGNKSSEQYMHDRGLDFERVSTVESLAVMLSLGRIQVVIMPEGVDTLQLDRVAVRFELGAPKFPVFHIFSSKRKELVSRWDESLRKMKKDGSYGRYLNQTPIRDPKG
jgi:hypothetical protein